MNRRPWDDTACDDLFLMFDTSAHIRDGVPEVDPSELAEHYRTCGVCRTAPLRLTPDGDYA